jgi:hypothetical protein
MSLIEDLQNREHYSCNNSSVFETLLNSLKEDERVAVEKSLDLIRKDARKGRAKVYSCAWLAEVLTSHGYPVSRTTIRRYMNENTDHRH